MLHFYDVFYTILYFIFPAVKLYLKIKLQPNLEILVKVLFKSKFGSEDKFLVRHQPHPNSSHYHTQFGGSFFILDQN